MCFREELRVLRQRCFLSQEAFAKEIGVSFSTVNRWEAGKTKPNLTAMKNIKAFCGRHKADYRNNKRGSAIPHLDKNLFFGTMFPLPPLAEQHRIVAKLEELLPLCERLK